MLGIAKASINVVDAFAISQSIVRKAAGSGALVDIDSGEGKTLTFAVGPPLPMNLGTVESGGWDFKTRYGCDWLGLRPSSYAVPAGVLELYRDTGRFVPISCGAPNPAESYLDSRSSLSRGRPRFLCWTSIQISSLPLLRHREHGRRAMPSQHS